MQAYGRAFARVYNERWIGFARRVAPRIQSFYESTPVGQKDRLLLDVCCGTGQLAAHFLEQGYRVTGIDLSESMLHYARENCAPYVEDGRVRFIQADAADFSLDERFGLAVSTFDALNHLPDRDLLRACFACVYAALAPEGFFIFDLNTRAGLARWNQISVEDTPEIMVVNRGFFDEANEKAWVRISGFVRAKDDLYERFEETAYNTVFDLEWVRNALLEVGWRSVYFARGEDLGTLIAEPEKEDRAFVVAHR